MTGIDVTPHLNFRGEARAALEFYQSVFGGDLVVVTYNDLGQAQEPGCQSRRVGAGCRSKWIQDHGL